jgi:cytochrome c oxidase subunit III
MSSEAGAAHPFDDLTQQREASTLGMWVFLSTEVLFFGALLAGYTVYRREYPAAFAAASHHLDAMLGATNTCVLLASSLTMALAVRAAAAGRKRPLLGYLAATIALGGAFLAIKGIEYAHKLAEGLVPGSGFRWTGEGGQAAELYFCLYFALTGLHALHMIAGIGVLLVILALGWKGRFGPHHHAPVEVAGLYWHFVDIVWIYLFPLLYLIGVR